LGTRAFNHRDKARDICDIEARHMLIVTANRHSAFDVVMNDLIPGPAGHLRMLLTHGRDRCCGRRQWHEMQAAHSIGCAAG
jgi:hypothetical protein